MPIFSTNHLILQSIYCVFFLRLGFGFDSLTVVRLELFSRLNRHRWYHIAATQDTAISYLWDGSSVEERKWKVYWIEVTCRSTR